MSGLYAMGAVFLVLALVAIAGLYRLVQLVERALVHFGVDVTVEEVRRKR